MSETELRRQSRYTWMLIAFTAIMFVLMAHQSRADINWDGDNAAGNFSFANNWYGETVPTGIGFGSGNLVFNYINNASQTSQYYDFASWININDIIWESTLQRAATLNGNGQGINFNQRLENRSIYTVTIGSSMNLSGAKNGAAAIELNPVNGDLVINAANFYNDNSKSYKVYGTNSKMVTINTSLGVGATASSVGFSVEQYSKAYFTAAQNFTGATDIKTGELWIGAGGSLNSASRVNLGLTDANTAKFYLTGGVTNSNNITVLSTNTGGVKVLGGLSASGTNVFAGNVTNNNSGGVWLENTVAGGTAAFTGVLSGTGNVTIGGLGRVLLSGTNNTFTGNININNGATVAIQQWGTNASGVASTGNHSQSTTATTGSSSWMIINGGTAQYVGAGETFGGGITIGTSGATIDASGTGTLNMNKPAGGLLIGTDQTTSRTLTVSGTSTLTNQLNWNITNGSGGAVITLNKAGTGNWRISGGSTFTGGVNILAGRIIVGGASEITSGYGSGDVRIYDGAGIRASGTTVRVDSTYHVYRLGGSNYIDWMDIGKATLTNNTTIVGNTAIGGETVAVSGNSTTTTLGSNTGIQESGGSFSLSKAGANSVLILNGSNSYSGGTFINSGTLQVTNTGTLGTTNSAVTLAGGILDLGNATRTNGTVTISGGTLTNGTVSASTINVSGGTLTGAGLTASSAFNYGGGATGLSSAVLGGAGRFNLTNSTLTLSDNFNTLTGGIGLLGGTLTVTNASNLGSGSFLLGSAGTLGTLQVNTTTSATNAFVVSDSSTNTSINVAASQTFTMSGTISQTAGGNNATKFGKDGAGTLVMAGTNGTYGGQLQIGQGTVIVGVNNALGTNVTTSARGVDLGLNVGDAAQANNVSLLISNGVTFGQSIYVAPSVSSSTRTIGLTSAGGTGSFTNEIYLDADLALTAGSATGVLTVSGNMVTNTSATPYGISVTTGTVLVSGANNYTGKNTLSGGTLMMGSTSALGAGSTDFNVGTWLSGGSLDLNGLNLGASTETLVFNSQNSYITNSSTTTAILGGTMFLTNSTANTFAVDSGKDINFTGSITNGSSSRVLVKNGGGTLTLSGTNGNNGQINVNGGTLKVGNVNAMLGSSTTTSNIAVAAGATLDLNGYTLTGLRTITNAGGTLANSASGAAIFSNSISMTADSTYNATGNMTLSGPIGGAFAFNKSGAGTITLTGSNTYSGGTTLNAGALSLSNNSALGTGTVTINGGSIGSAGGTRTLANNLVLNTNLSVNSGGAFNVSGNVDLAGGTRVISQNGVNSQYSGVISNGGLTISNSGSGIDTILSGANTYSGATTMRQGILNLSGSGSLSNSAVNLTGGSASTLSIANVTTSTEIGSLTGNAGSKVDLGAKTLIVGRDNTSTTFAGTFTNTTNAARIIKNGTGELVISNTGAGSSYAQMQVGNGKVTLAAGSYSTSTNTGVRGLVLGLDAGDQSTANDTAFYVSGGVTMSNSIYVAPAASGLGLRTLGTESTSGTATFNNEISLGGDLQVSAASGGTAVFSGNMINSGALTKIGAGTVTLSGANTYSGGTVVNNGTLAIGSNNNAISGGALTLSGGTLQSTGTSMNFNVGAVTFGGTGELQIAANSKFVSSGAVTVNGSSNFINLTAAFGTYTNGTTYDLVTGTSLGGTGAISLKGLAVGGQTIALGSSYNVGRTTYTFTNTSTAYQLSVSGGSAWNLTWNPATSSGTWNTTDTNTPWLKNTDSSATYFVSGDNVTLGSAATIAVDSAGVTAGTMSVTNASGTVALSGGSIAAASLTQSGSGTVTMSNSLAIAGALTNSAGTLSNDSTTAANSLSVSGGTVNLNGAASITNGVTVSGGAVTLATNSTISGGVNLSSGSLALNGANTISGGVTNTGGTLLVGNNGALGNNTLFVSNNGVLGVTNSAVSLLTNAVTVGVGGATVSNAVATTLGGVITNVSGSANLILTKDGAGALTLTNALGVTGTTGSIALNVTNGNLVLSGAQKYITNSQINAGAKLVLDGVTVNARGADFSGGGSIEVTNNSAWNNSIANSSITNTVVIGSGSKLSVGTSSSYYLEFLKGITGAGNFTVTTGGTNRITGNSTVAYMTIDSGGRLYLNNGTASNTVITNNGTLDIGISSSITNITGLSSGATMYGGNISGNGNISITGSQNIYLAGNISGSNNVSLNSGSSGTVVFLTGSNSFTGGINFAHSNAQTAWFNNSNALGSGTISNSTSTTAKLGYSGSANTADYTFGNAIVTGTTNTAILSVQTGVSNTVRLGGVISGLGQLKITSSSNGIVYLNNANNTYTGGTEIGTGRFGLGSDGAFGATNGVVNFGTSANSYLVVTSNVSFNASRNFTMNAASYTANIDTGANNVTINGTLTGTGGGNLNKIGTGSLTLAGGASYTGTTTLSGTLNLGGSTLTNTALTINTGTLTNGSIRVDASSTGITVNGSSTIAANLSGAAGLAVNNANTTVRLSGSNSFSGLIDLGGAANESLEVTGVNALSSAANLTGSSSSANTPTLSLLTGGAYTMNKFKDGNMLFVGTNASTTSLTFTNATNHTISSGSKTLTASNVNVTFSGDVDLAANITNKKVTLEGNSDFTFNGVISNSGASGNNTNAFLVMSSSGTLLLAGANTFDGGVTMNAGTVAISNNAAFGTGVVNIASNSTIRALANLTVGNNYSLGTNRTATFDVGSGLALTNSGAISGSGAINKTGAGTLHLTGANSYANGATVTDGTLAGNTGSLISNITNNATVEFVQSSAGTYSSVISGSGAFRKSGAGELTLNNANTYSGGTTITGGTLKLNCAGNGSGGTIVGTIAVNGGTLLLGQANQISDSSAVTLGGGTLNTGGFSDRAGKLTVSAGSAISGLVATTGGAASANDFLFSSVDLTSYATSSGASLNLGGGYGYRATINIASSNFTDWSGYSTTSINNFADKVMFGSTGMKAQINFNGSTGLTYITAIPEPKVYVAMAMLVALVGVAEYKRRKKAVKV